MSFHIFYISSVVFLYYTVWALFLPFVDDTHPVQNFFPAREWVIRIPVIILLTAVGVIGSFLGTVMVLSNRPRPKAST
ncbi:dolichol phosphate-mannose biosynthesis regulatory [Limtongia smithiae]|uniref:dolichol phosphate-mannose biosynthesis regulatory n=1 Tax=Limtongia smithiae TaxID=1125753 RepID=UPI0034CD9F4C